MEEPPPCRIHIGADHERSDKVGEGLLLLPVCGQEVVGRLADNARDQVERRQQANDDGLIGACAGEPGVVLLGAHLFELTVDERTRLAAERAHHEHAAGHGGHAG